jgi:hypothetical protein
VGGRIQRQVETASVRDITESGSFKDGIEVNPQVAEDVLKRVRDYYNRRGTKVEYVSGRS